MLHPSPASDTRPVPQPEESEVDTPSFTWHKIFDAVRSFPAGSACGPDGTYIRPGHIKELCRTNIEEQYHFHLSLTSFCNEMIKGNIPKNVCPAFFGANLCALSKGNGGVRPIAVGNTLRRLMAKNCVYSVKSELMDHFAPNQLGFALPHGAEAAVHATRRFCDDSLNMPECLVKLDFQNAFNSVRRDYMLEEAQKVIPAIYPFVLQAYNNDADLLYLDTVIKSSVGVQQGDPLGPLLFCMAINPLVKQLESPLNIWYLDDGNLGGPIDVIMKDVARVQDFREMSGLQLRLDKCEMCILEPVSSNLSKADQSLNFGLKDIDDLIILGAPVRNRSRENNLVTKLEELKRLCSRVKLLEAHDGLFLLRHCFSAPKLLYTLRCAPCFYSSEILSEYDSVLRSTLEAVLNIQLCK